MNNEVWPVGTAKRVNKMLDVIDAEVYKAMKSMGMKSIRVGKGEILTTLRVRDLVPKPVKLSHGS